MGAATSVEDPIDAIAMTAATTTGGTGDMDEEEGDLEGVAEGQTSLIIDEELMRKDPPRLSILIRISQFWVEIEQLAQVASPSENFRRFKQVY